MHAVRCVIFDLDSLAIDQPTLNRFLGARSEVRFLDETVYLQLFRINRGFGAVLRALNVLRDHGGFHASELRHFRNLAKEARASTNSYLAAVIESAETDEAGRLFRKRMRREKAED